MAPPISRATLLAIAMSAAALGALPSPGGAETALVLAQQEGGRHAGPRAYHAMCAREPALCEEDRRAGRIPGAGPAATLDAAGLSRLAALNRRLNAEIAPTADAEIYGESDYWTRGVTAGDCEDYIIAKKRALIDEGWAADQLLYAVVEGVTTPYHAVLIVRTDRGDLVLDNLRDEILDWQESGYRFVIRQSAASPDDWVRVLDPGPAGSRLARH